MPVGILPSPSTPLYRIGRAPDAASFPPFDRLGDGRFDDPQAEKRYRVLYTGDRLACFYEVLAAFRPDLDGIDARPINDDWIGRRRIARIRIDDPDRLGMWLDLASPATFADFRRRFASLLRSLSFADFDLSAATSDRRELTQVLGSWAHDEGFWGIRYPTRHGAGLSCWAIFEGTPIVAEKQTPLRFDDPDLATVAAAWGLARER